MLIAPPRCCRLSCMLAVVFALTSTAQAGKLSAARSEIRSESERDDSDDDSNNSGLLSAARDEVRNDDPPRRKRRRRYYGYDYPVAPIVIYESTDADPPAVPQPLTRPDVIDPQHPAIVVEPIPQPICKYPYSGRFGGYRIDKPWAARLNLEHGFRTASVQREGFGLLLESEQRLGLQVNWNGYDERLPFGRHDHLQFGDVNVLVRVFDEPSAQVRLGVGVNWLHDRFGTDAGLNLTAAADVFPVKPIVLSGQLDVGAIGDTSTFHTRVTAGVLWKRLEFFGGYDYRTFGSVSLHGPVAGLRIWF